MLVSFTEEAFENIVAHDIVIAINLVYIFSHIFNYIWDLLDCA